MRKDKTYAEARFSADVLKESATTLRAVAARSKTEPNNYSFSVEHDDSKWTYDTLEEFLADYRKFQGRADFRLYGSEHDLDVSVSPRETTVRVKAPSRSDIETVFEKHLENSKLSPIAMAALAKARPIVFIGHGRSALWRDLKDHLQDKHGIKVAAYETGARAGHTIRDFLEELVSNSLFALLVLTGEDEQSDGTLHARQNVIHEVGLFQGRLGFSRAIILLEDGTEEFSNVHGIQQVRFSKGNIRETFGEVLATLRREFGE
ncbi:MAG: nucleotide-binding protein [Nitrospiraceae bacterium]